MINSIDKSLTNDSKKACVNVALTDKNQLRKAATTFRQTRTYSYIKMISHKKRSCLPILINNFILYTDKTNY